MQRFVRMGAKKEKPRYKPSGRGKKGHAPAYVFSEYHFGAKTVCRGLCGWESKRKRPATSRLEWVLNGSHLREFFLNTILG